MGKMKYIIENKSKAKDRDVIEIIKNQLDYIDLSKDLVFHVKNITFKLTSKKNVVTFTAEDLNNEKGI